MTFKDSIRQRMTALSLMLMTSVTFSLGAEDDYQLLINRINSDFQRNPNVESSLKRYDTISYNRIIDLWQTTLFFANDNGWQENHFSPTSHCFR